MLLTGVDNGAVKQWVGATRVCATRTARHRSFPRVARSAGVRMVRLRDAADRRRGGASGRDDVCTHIVGDIRRKAIGQWIGRSSIGDDGR
ncbi:hypothetical protein [Streptomyces avicenniae]|uniref:hypothetical protein n=1 Tax=Streptomyces avicenniae TaxID=500153 RepID=UPI00069A0E94|nr:hypothetical protein [Streptomyces avicenniae]